MDNLLVSNISKSSERTHNNSSLLRIKDNDEKKNKNVTISRYFDSENSIKSTSVTNDSGTLEKNKDNTPEEQTLTRKKRKKKKKSISNIKDKENYEEIKEEEPIYEDECLTDLKNGLYVMIKFDYF